MKINQYCDTGKNKYSRNIDRYSINPETGPEKKKSYSRNSRNDNNFGHTAFECIFMHSRIYLNYNCPFLLSIYPSMSSCSPQNLSFAAKRSRSRKALKKLWDLGLQCLERDPDARPSLDDLLSEITILKSSLKRTPFWKRLFKKL